MSSRCSEAEEALAPEGDLEKDQLDRVNLVNLIRWSRSKEKKRIEAKASLQDPSFAWKERLRCWRKVIVIWYS